MPTRALPHAFCAATTSSIEIGAGVVTFVNASVPAMAPLASASGPRMRTARVVRSGAACCVRTTLPCMPMYAGGLASLVASSTAARTSTAGRVSRFSRYSANVSGV
eukprot:7289755-Prymnesium_polylepis.1